MKIGDTYELFGKIFIVTDVIQSPNGGTVVVSTNK